MTTFIIASIIVAILLSAKFVDGIPKLYVDRSCQGPSWRRQFPSASKQQVRDFLSLFIDAFAFREEHRLKFNPEDEVMEVYRSLYPSSGGMDSLELETLVALLEKRYGYNLESVWHEHMTLGEIFSGVLAPNHSLKADVPDGTRL